MFYVIKPVYRIQLSNNTHCLNASRDKSCLVFYWCYLLHFELAQFLNFEIISVSGSMIRRRQSPRATHPRGLRIMCTVDLETNIMFHVVHYKLKGQAKLFCSRSNWIHFSTTSCQLWILVKQDCDLSCYGQLVTDV